MGEAKRVSLRLALLFLVAFVSFSQLRASDDDKVINNNIFSVFFCMEAEFFFSPFLFTIFCAFCLMHV